MTSNQLDLAAIRLTPEREAEIRAWNDAIGVRKMHGDLPSHQALSDLLAELSSVRAERDQAHARIVELERPAVEAKRNEIRNSFHELIGACHETKDYEGAFDVQCRLREREEQWAAEDAANQPTVPAARSAAV